MQVDNTSLKDQEEKIRMYAKLHDIVIDKIFIDKAVSGKSTDRPEYDKMMDYLEKNDITIKIEPIISKYVWSKVKLSQ